MAATMYLPKGIIPKLTESYLMNLVGVVDASVWWEEGSLNAHVVVLDDAPFDAKSMRSCCMQDLGIHQTPRSLTIACRRLRVA